MHDHLLNTLALMGNIAMENGDRVTAFAWWQVAHDLGYRDGLHYTEEEYAGYLVDGYLPA
tara:strand:- start:1003 stop:1182 length:180 start_codon:yes stop_codon:yes gene_type:complete